MSTQPIPRPQPRRKRRVFLWVFLAAQALFVLWIVAGLAASSPCRGMSAHDCATVTDTAHGVAAGLQVIVWVIVDFLLAVVYGVYRLARCPGRELP